MARQGPLRKIVGYSPNLQYPRLFDEVLECGHTQRPVTDIYGETVAYRRRCRKCKEGKPVDLDPTTGERCTP